MLTHSLCSQKTPAEEILYREYERAIPIQQTLFSWVSYRSVSGLAIQPNHTSIQLAQVIIVSVKHQQQTEV